MSENVENNIIHMSKSSIGCFLMWRVAEYELKQYEKAYGKLQYKHNRLRKRFEKEQLKSVSKGS